MDTATCCYIGPDGQECQELAEWQLVHGKGLDDWTLCCSEHLGLMMTDAPEHWVYPCKPVGWMRKDRGMRNGMMVGIELFERLAALEHESWANWMKYQLEKVSLVPNVGVAEHRSGEQYIDRWTRLMNTPYDKLIEDEKESDRIEVRKTLALLLGLTLDEKGSPR